MQIDGYFYVHISDQRHTDFTDKNQVHELLNYGARDSRAVCGFRSVFEFESNIFMRQHSSTYHRRFH